MNLARRVRAAGLPMAAMLAFALSPAPAGAETLRDALVRTYGANPTLTGARASLRAIDENVAIAKGNGRIQVTGTAGITQSFRGIGRLRNGGRALTGGVSIDYPVFQGGRVANAVRAADSRVIAGRADLRAVEGDVFTQAVSVYMDVIRDTSIVDLNRNLVKVLETNLQASRDRFEVGDLTRTDVAQSEARLSGARSQLAAAEGQLTRSREVYRQVTGALPGTLEPPPPLPTLPATPDEAVRTALANNPDVASASAAARAAGYDVRSVRGERLPSLSVTSGADYQNYLGTLDEAVGAPPGTPLDNSSTDSRIGLTARVPFYQGGVVASRVRQAQALESASLEDLIGTERLVIADARAAHASWRAAQDQIRSSETAVAANRLALEGTRAENSVGTRTILDVLNAEQELLGSEVALVTARRDEYVAGFALLNAMGQAEMRDLGLDGGPLYDPVANYDRVSRKASDWGGDPRPVPQASRTNESVPSPTAEPVLHYDAGMQ